MEKKHRCMWLFKVTCTPDVNVAYVYSRQENTYYFNAAPPAEKRRVHLVSIMHTCATDGKCSLSIRVIRDIRRYQGCFFLKQFHSVISLINRSIDKSIYTTLFSNFYYSDIPDYVTSEQSNIIFKLCI